MKFNIAIDGPAGAGKSTVARRVARELGFIYVDTGALYRAIAVYLLKCGIAADDAEGIRTACREIQITIAYQEGEQQVILNGENVTGQLRTEAVGNMASVSSANPDVRAALLELQRELARNENVVMDGRDIGTFVLPEAQLKIYLTASTAMRARRRYMELLDKGVVSSQEAIEQDIIERDTRDMNREIAPLKQAADAVYLDTSEMDIAEAVDYIMDLYKEVRHGCR